MYKKRRQNELLQYIMSHEEASVSDLSSIFHVSGMTVRRDLSELELMGLINRTHGGALSPGAFKGEELYENKQLQNPEVKLLLAKKALELMNDIFEKDHTSKSIFLDAGTTCYKIASQLQDINNLSVFTNDLNIACELCAKRLENVYVTGGKIQTDTESVVGIQSNNFIKEFNFTVCFIGITAVSSKLILSSPSEEKAFNKKTIMRNSLIKVLVCDKSKFNQKSLYNVTDISSFDYVITDYEFSLSQKKLIEDGGCVVYAI